jgi:hypothetical protein
MLNQAIDWKAEAEATEATFEGWKRGYRFRLAEHAERVRDALRRGATVTEHLAGHDIVWPEAATRCFLPEYRTGDHIADHIHKRHWGFGFEHTIDGVRYALGREVSP